MAIDTTVLSPTNVLVVAELFLLLNYIVFRLGEKVIGWLFFKKKVKSPYEVKKSPEKPLNRQKTQPELDDDGYLDYTQLN